jgi:mannosyltransferase
VHGWLLIGAATLAAALRWFRIDAQSLWYDEGISAHQLTRSFAEILPAAARDTHPPLYYWTLKAWASVFGSSELGLRSLSAFWGVVVVAVTFVLARRLYGTLTATLAAVLLAVAPLAVYYSQEVRMYTQVTALGLLAAYGYSRRRYWLYAVAGLAALYSQYLALALLAALVTHALVTAPGRPRREWLMWLAANGAIALGFLPWLPTFIAQQSHALNVSPRTPLGLLVGTLEAYGGGLLHGDLFLTAGSLLVLLAIVGLLCSLIGRRADPGWRRRFDSGTLAALLWTAPLALVLALGLRSGLFEIRYLVLSLPGLVILAAYGVVRVLRQPILASAVAGLAVVPAVLALQQQYFDPALARDDYRGLVATIERNALPTDAVVLSAPNQTEIFDYYYHGGMPQFGLPAQRPIDADDTRQRLDSIRASHGRVWLVSWAMNEADPKGVINDWLLANGFQATHEWYGSVQLALIGFGPADAATHKLDVALDNGVVLDAYRMATGTYRPGDTLALTLVWRAANGPTDGRWKVFTHLLDGDSRVVAQRDAEPGDSLRPTTTWSKGEQIEDNYGIAIPPDLAPGVYTLEIGMYQGERRSLFEGYGNHLLLGQVSVQP